MMLLPYSDHVKFLITCKYYYGHKDSSCKQRYEKILSTNCKNNILLLLQSAIVICDINLIKAIILSGKMPKYAPNTYVFMTHYICSIKT
jgi:hypothetical protein